MRDRAQLDAKSVAVLHHLEAYVNGDESSDDSIIQDYIRFIKTDRSVVTGHGDILASAVLTSFVPLLSRILNSDLYADDYAQLLMTMLEQLRFADAMKFFPAEAVVEALKSPAYAVVYMAIHVIKVNLVQADADAIKFLLQSPSLQVVTRRVLESVDAPTNIVSDTEECVLLFSKLEYFDISKWLFLDSVNLSSSMKDATLLARYLSVVQSLAPKLSAKAISQLADFDMTTILDADAEEADPFLASLLIAFYSVMVPKVPLHLLVKCIDQCVQNLVKRRQLSQYDFIINPALSHLLANVSHASREWQEYVKLQIQQHPQLITFDFSSADEVGYFCKINLSVITNKSDFFHDNFSKWTFQLASYAHFCCLIHLIDNEDFFAVLVESRKLEDEKLNNLPQNLLFELVERLTRYDYSSTYLLHKLPHVVLTHLMAVDPNVVNPEIWEFKKQALQNLLMYRNVDLGFWQQGLSQCFREMHEGRQTRSVEPKVDVTDEAM